MATDVNITFINRAQGLGTSTVFASAVNGDSTDALKHGVAWKTMNHIGLGSSTCMTYSANTEVQAEWGQCSKTKLATAEVGQRYEVVENETGVVLVHQGNAARRDAIELGNLIKVPNGIRANLCKDGAPLVSKNIVAYNQKATFILQPRLYWGIAEEIKPGQSLSTACIKSCNLFSLNLEGITNVAVTLTGNPKEGYKFEANYPR